MYYALRVECRNRNCGKSILIGGFYDDAPAAETAFLKIWQDELGNFKGAPGGAVAPPLRGHCADGCLRTYLYSSRDVFLTWEKE